MLHSVKQLIGRYQRMKPDLGGISNFIYFPVSLVGNRQTGKIFEYSQCVKDLENSDEKSVDLVHEKKNRILKCLFVQFIPSTK